MVEENPVFIGEDGLPALVAQKAAESIERFLEKLQDNDHWFRQAANNPQLLARLNRVWGASPFVFETCLAFPELFQELLDSGDLLSTYSPQTYTEKLSSVLDGLTTEQELHRKLRQFRRREMVRIVWRDFCRDADMQETTGDVTRLAEACIQLSLDFLHESLASQFGAPVGNSSGKPQHLLVLGMGKMGAWELNVSSDIDLIFVFPEVGNTSGGRREISNQEYFIKLGQKLIQALDNNTVDGFVFRVDMRLRPYGQSGALAINFDALENYLHTQGRDWERYAMIKARVVAGDPEESRELMNILRPFTYRKYIDFSAIQSLRDMKTMIRREVTRLGIHSDVKKGAGGIREIEFIAQAFQLIRGGKDHRFQTPSLQTILQLLDEEHLLPNGAGHGLWQAYVFLRNTEHAIQGHKDQQTQALPDTDYGRDSVAAVMGYHGWDDFIGSLEKHRALVSRIFDGIASQPDAEQQESPVSVAARAAWISDGDAGELAKELQSLGFQQAGQESAKALVALRESKTVQALEATARARLDTFIPLLLAACAGHPRGGDALLRLLPLVQGILRRSAYLVLLNENLEALKQLVRLCGESPWIAEQISRYPALLDELLDPRALYTPADRDSLAQELRQLLLRIPEEDLEAQMDVLRYFRHAHSLRIAACEVVEVLPLMKASDNLTWLAEVILEQVLVMAWRWMLSRHGRPGKDSPDGDDPGLLVVGYGKMGGIELGHSSDLDLVFIHNANPNLATDGEKAIDNATFFNRLGQRMVHILTTQTVSGDLYEVDMRLRPNGNSGLLVPTFVAYEKYIQQDAWTWELQALVRARPVAGDQSLARQFEQSRRAALCLSRDNEILKNDVMAMRDKMRTHLGSGNKSHKEGVFQLKQDAGGIVDIEFIVQYLVLRHSHSFPELVEYSDNMRILDAIKTSALLPAESVSQLQGAYLFCRTLGHRLSLQGSANTIDAENPYWQEANKHRGQVSTIWQGIFGGT